MNQKTIIIAGSISFICVSIFSGYTFIKPSTSPSTPKSSPVMGNNTKGYTSTDIATHNKQSSCWTSINGKVYDVTNFITQHKGGSARILQLCGIDGSAAFNAQHVTNNRAENTLARYYIGDFIVGPTK